MRRARKSELQPGTFRGTPAVAKRLRSASPVWRWYFAREQAIYRAFADAPPVRAPRLLAADDGTLVIELLAGAPLATRRTPHADLPAHAIDALVATRARLAAWTGCIPDAPPPVAVRRELRARLLEDPTAPVAWITDGLARAERLGIVADAAPAIAAIRAHAPVAFCHGDLLLRNVVGDGLVDWECAGMHAADWDLALLWSQLGPDGRARIEGGIDAGPRKPAFDALCAFAIAREIRFLHAFRASDRHPELVRQQVDLTAVLARLG